MLELGYRHHLATQVFLQPNLQLVVHPSGFSTIPTALVLGLQAGLRL
ncbi:MAG: carbohydrate porin [Cyanobacteriota bacterium]